MIRMVICLSKPGEAELVFGYVRDIVRSLRVKCEVSCCADHDVIRKRISDDVGYYDIFLLDAFDKQCLKTAEVLRKNNLISSLLFVARDAPKIHNIFIYRPSFLVTKLDDPGQLHEAVRLAFTEQLRAHPYFTVQNKDMLIRVNYEDIIWFESRQRIVILHGRKTEISFYAKLKDVQSMLPGERFVRCHQSCIVNMDMAERLDKTNRCFYMTSGDIVEISKSCYAQVTAYFEKCNY